MDSGLRPLVYKNTKSKNLTRGLRPIAYRALGVQKKQEKKQNKTRLGQLTRETNRH